MKYAIAILIIVTAAFLVYLRLPHASVLENAEVRCEQNGIDCSCNPKAPAKTPSERTGKGCGCGNRSCST